MVRRAFDIALSGTALIVLGVPLALIAGAIVASSGRPILFRQPRIGSGGQPFFLYKFRTMRVNAGGAAVTIDADERIFPLGRLLRRWKLDELPQFWNVLRGDMSIVGPRPEVERFVRHYTADERRILAAKPGLASMAQLLYPDEPEVLRAASDPEHAYVTMLMPKKVAVDVHYENSRTLLSDMRLLARLALMVVKRARL
jgi:lipopolysaccharide/colanic/teichoic acid biosynthesis glycosyltransferase